MNPHTRVPVLATDNTPLMPTKYSRAEKLVSQGAAEWLSNDLTIKAIRLLREPSARHTQPLVLGCDPGKLFTGMALVSAKAVLLLLHLVLPFERVKARKAAQKLLRRARRGRRINRQVVFDLRNHRQKRFHNRKQQKLPPSIAANKGMEKRCITEIFKLFPVSAVVWELVKADVDRTSGRKGARSGKGFSPVMVGQKQMLAWLSAFTVVHTREGWQKDGNGTAQIRTYLGLVKEKQQKAKQVPQTHAVDGLALAASAFIRYAPFQTANTHGHDWVGAICLTSAPFRVLTRPCFYRRQLHFEKVRKGGVRKRKGGTVTPFGFRSGDFVQAEKAGKVYRGWIGGYSEVNKVVSVYDHNWKRLGQFSVSQVQLVKRKTGGSALKVMMAETLCQYESH